MARHVCVVAAALALLLLAAPADAVDRSKFKTCNQSGFCRRHRSKASESPVRVDRRRLVLPCVRAPAVCGCTHPAGGTSRVLRLPAPRCVQLQLDAPPALEGGQLVGTVSGAGSPLLFTAAFLSSGAVRVRLTEKDMEARWQVGVPRTRGGGGVTDA